MHFSSSTRAEKLVRGWIIAITANLLAAASHGLAGGHLPHPLLLALSTALSAVLCIAVSAAGFSGRGLNRLVLATSVAGSQGMLHFLFAHSGAVAYLQTGAHSHHGMSGTAIGVHVTAQQHSGSPAMLVFHLLAAVFTYWLLRRGEQTLTQCIEFLQVAVQRVYALVLSPVIYSPVRALLMPVRPTFVPKTFLIETRALRGPPCVTAL